MKIQEKWILYRNKFYWRKDNIDEYNRMAVILCLVDHEKQLMIYCFCKYSSNMNTDSDVSIESLIKRFKSLV